MLRLCVYASVPTQAWLEALRQQADGRASLILVGTAASARVAVQARHPELTAARPAELAAALAALYPGDDIAIVRGDAQLPAYALARLRHALDMDGIMAVGALDNLDPQRSPLPAATRSDASVERIDALVLAYGEHRLIDSADVSAVLSVWRGSRFDTPGQRLVSADHVYVAAGNEGVQGPPAAADPRDPLPPSPLHSLRRRVLAALDQPMSPAPYGLDGKPVLLHVLHGWGGGAERWVNDLAGAWDDAHHLVLIARGSAQRRIHGEWLELRAGACDAPPLRSLALPLPIADTVNHDSIWTALFESICRDYSVSAVLVSSLIGHSLDALRSGLPTLLLVHDHYPLWPLLHRDFGDPTLAFDDAQLQRDLNTPAFEFLRREPRHWQALRQQFVAAVLAAKATLVAPSRSALANELRLAPEFASLDAHVIAHGLAPWPADTQSLPAPPLRKRLRLVVVGRIRSGKGGQLLAAALDGLREHADLLLLGAGAAAQEFFGAAGVHIVLDYHRADLPKRLAEWNPDAALLLPTVSETYSYALSELESLGLPVIATRVGALAERIVDGENGFLVDPNAAAVIARVAALAADPGVLDHIRATLRGRRPIALFDMVASYRPLLKLAANPGLRYPLRELDLATLDRAALDTALGEAQAAVRLLREQLAQLRKLADQRGDWGHALDRDLGRSQSRVQALQGDLAQSNSWANALDKELTGVRARVAQLQKDVVERTGWALGLEAQLDERLQWARKLEIQLDERLAWARRLESELAERLHWAQTLESQLDERTCWAQTLESQLDERTRWAQTLESQLDERTRWAQTLESQLDERTRWAIDLDTRFRAQGQRTLELEADLQGRTEWARSLESQLEERTEWARALDTQLEERTRWAHSLDAEVAMQREQINQLNAQWAQELQRQLDERLAWVHRLEAELADRAAEIAALNARIAELHHEVDTRTEWAQGLEARLNALHAEFDERTEWALSLDAEVAAQREQLLVLQAIERNRDEMLASRSWRLLEPFRRLSTRLRRLRMALGYRRQRLFSAIARTRGSLARRGLVATIRRALFELRRSPIRVMPVLDGEPATGFEPFALPTSKRARVSIVIPVYNKIDYTVACLRSLAEHAGTVPFEVIVVDDGSGDETPLRLREIDGIRPLRNRKNLGFVGSCNAGAAAAKGEFVLFLNNDTVVTAGWLEALVACHEQEPKAGLVGAKLVYPDGRLQEAGGIIFNDGSGWNYGRFDDPGDPRYCFRREVDYCSGAAILIRRELFERLGRFDQRYAPAYYEDTDLAFAVRAAGYRVIVEPASTVIHFEGITAGTDTASGVKQYQVVNREKFLAKWDAALLQQPKPYPQTPIGIAATHRARLRALIIDATTPAPDQDSGSVRMVNLMRVLNDLGAQTTFMAENRAWIERDTPALQQLGVEVLYHPHVSDPVALFRERGPEWDVILLSRHYIAVNYIALAREYAPQARLVFDTVDLHYLREQRAAELEGRDELRRTAASTRVQELQVMRDCDVTLVVSPVEQELLRNDAPDVRVEVLSNVHEVFGCRKPFAQRHDLVFVGGFQHPPNIDAVQWFVGSVFPLVRPHLPGVKFHIIGSKITDEVLALAADDVIVHGYIEDIAPYMDDSRISIAPLRYGAGVKGKVNMAMSYGLPVAATPIAVEGMHVRIGDDVLVAEDAAGLAAEIVRLYSDEALWNRLSANGLANVERHFSFDAAKVAVQRFLA